MNSDEYMDEFFHITLGKTFDFSFSLLKIAFNKRGLKIDYDDKQQERKTVIYYDGTEKFILARIVFFQLEFLFKFKSGFV